MTRQPLPLVGAHISTAGDLAEVLPRARQVGAKAVQVFPSNPRQWGGLRHDAAVIRRLGEELESAGVPLFIHAIYLINLASPDPELRHRSAAALADALRFGSLGRARGVVTHVGSHRGEGFAAGLEHVFATVEEARRLALGAERGEGGASELPTLLLEGSAGAGDSFGKDLEELAGLLERLPGPTGVCLDTAHLFAAGYPVHTREGLDAFLGEFGRRAGLEKIGLVHLNDSKAALGSRSDRHENLQEGLIGRDGLAAWLSHPALLRVPFVLEVPGFDGKGPDRRNLLRARRLRRLAGPGLHGG